VLADGIRAANEIAVVLVTGARIDAQRLLQS
jgi:hypothetical protein